MHSTHIAAVQKFYEVVTTGDTTGFDEILAAGAKPMAAAENGQGQGQ